MKAYELKLKRNDLFLSYLIGEKITLATDKENPYPCTKTKWNKETKQISRSIPPYNPDKLVYPTYAINKEEFDEFLSYHIPNLIDYTLKIDKNYNLIFLIKEWDEVIELGMAGTKGYTDNINLFAQNIVNRYLKLKPFW